MTNETFQDPMIRLGSIRNWYKQDVIFGYYEGNKCFWAQSEDGICSGPDMIDCIQLVGGEDATEGTIAY